MNTVHAEKREVEGKSVLNRLRGGGFVPAIVYGYKTESTPIAVQTKEIERTIRELGRNAILNIELDGKKINAVLNDVQKNAIKGNYIHLDFLAVNMAEALEMDVSVVLVGDAIGVREGGILQQLNRELKILVKPSDVPESIEIDITNMQIGDIIAVEDIRKTTKFEIVDEDDFVLASVTPPIAEKELEANLEEAEPVVDQGAEPKE